MQRLYLLLLCTLFLCIGCEWKFRSSGNGEDDMLVRIERYDRIEALYLTTGDYAALNQMNTDYPQQTRMLIENVLQLGKVDDQQASARFLHYFQDSTLQAIISDVELQYAEIDDLNVELADAFERLTELLPTIEIPSVYAQIGSLDQSIVIGDGTLGISLDKYLGTDHPLYLKYGYSDEQRQMMQRAFIVPDCLGFYLLSLYPMPFKSELTKVQRDQYMGRIQWVVNCVLKRRLFDNEHVEAAQHYMTEHKGMTVDGLLSAPLMSLDEVEQTL